MTHEEFSIFLKMLDRRLNGVLDSKGKFYTDENRFSNFISAGLMNNESTKEALWGMVTKHIIALKDMIKSEKEYDFQKWVDVAGDIINYMKLLLGIVAGEQSIMSKYEEIREEINRIKKGVKR